MGKEEAVRVFGLHLAHLLPRPAACAVGVFPVNTCWCWRLGGAGERKSGRWRDLCDDPLGMGLDGKGRPQQVSYCRARDETGVIGSGGTKGKKRVCLQPVNFFLKIEALGL